MLTLIARGFSALVLSPSGFAPGLRQPGFRIAAARPTGTRLPSISPRELAAVARHRRS